MKFWEICFYIILPISAIIANFFSIFLNVRNFIRYRKKEWYSRKDTIIHFSLILLALLSLTIILL
jgi:hypothetical protein